MSELGNDLESSIIASLDGQDVRLLPYIPELLSDLDSIGTDPALIENLLIQHGNVPTDARLLDLGCGKGAVSLRLVKNNPWYVVGVDGLPAFVEAARTRASRSGLAERCQFHVADIRTWSCDQRFDVVILGAIGPVLGTTRETLLHVKKFLSQSGMVAMDETFVRVGVKCRNPLYRTREAVLKEIPLAGFDILAEKAEDSALQEAENQAMFKAIKRRADALAARLPHLRVLFESYVTAQEHEFDVLDKDVVNVTLLLENK